MKKITALFMGFMLVLGLTACGNNEKSRSSIKKATTETPKGTTSTATTSSSGNTKSISGNTLVVYYSASGYTEKVAKAIASETNGDIFTIEPVEPYSDEDLDWTDSDSRVSKEHDDESLRNIKLKSTFVPDWGKYDTVFVGYPIWWGIAAWPVDNFIKGNDFTGKTVIPFSTSTSSGLGDSGELLKEMAGTGEWSEGKRFRSNASSEEVVSWVKELGK